MKARILVLILSATAVATGASAFAGEIYKYVDEEGNIHYVDRPSGEAGEERLNVTYASTDSSTVSSQVQKRNDYMAARERAREEAASSREADAMARAEMEQRAAKCQEHRSRLETYLQSRRLYREDEAGEREYLDEKQVLEARQKVEELIEENCS